MAEKKRVTTPLPVVLAMGLANDLIVCPVLCATSWAADDVREGAAR
jgi:hypothetical protein